MMEEAEVCLRAQVIHNYDGEVRRGSQARGLTYNNGGVEVGQGIVDTFKESETTTEAERIWGQRRRLRRCDDRPE